MCQGSAQDNRLYRPTAMTPQKAAPDGVLDARTDLAKSIAVLFEIFLPPAASAGTGTA